MTCDTKRDEWKWLFYSVGTTLENISRLHEETVTNFSRVDNQVSVKISYLYIM